MPGIEGKCPHPECEYPANPDPRVSAAGFCCEKCEARFNGEEWGFELGTSKKQKKNPRHTGACTCHTYDEVEGSFMMLGKDGKRQKLDIPKQTGPQLCSIHKKQRRMSNLEGDGMGGFICYAGFECDQFGPEDQLGPPNWEDEEEEKEKKKTAAAAAAATAAAERAATAPAGRISDRLNGVWNALNSGGKTAATASSASWAGADDSWEEQPSDADAGWAACMSHANPDVVSSLLSLVEGEVEEAPAVGDSWSGGDATWGEESWPAEAAAPSNKYAWAQAPAPKPKATKGVWGKGSGDDWGKGSKAGDDWGKGSKAADDWGKGSKAGDDWGKGSKGAWGKDSGDAWGMSKGSKDSGGGWGKGGKAAPEEQWELAWVPKGTAAAQGLCKGGGGGGDGGWGDGW